MVHSRRDTQRPSTCSVRCIADTGLHAAAFVILLGKHPVAFWRRAHSSGWRQARQRTPRTGSDLEEKRQGGGCQGVVSRAQPFLFRTLGAVLAAAVPPERTRPSPIRGDLTGIPTLLQWTCRHRAAPDHHERPFHEQSSVFLHRISGESAATAGPNGPVIDREPPVIHETASGYVLGPAGRRQQAGRGA